MKSPLEMEPSEYIRAVHAEIDKHAREAQRRLNQQLFSDASPSSVLIPKVTRWQRVSRAVRRYGANWRLALRACWLALRGYYPMDDPDEDY